MRKRLDAAPRCRNRGLSFIVRSESGGCNISSRQNIPGAAVTRPVVRIYNSVSATAFGSALALVPGLAFVVFITLVPFTILLFGFPTVVLILVGLHLLRSGLRKSPQVVLDRSGLRIVTKAPDTIRWADIAGVTHTLGLPFNNVKISLRENVSCPASRANPIRQFIERTPRLRSELFINTSMLAITSSDLAALINDYRINFSTINDANTHSLCERNLPLNRKLMNWGFLVAIVAIFAHFALTLA